MGCFQRLLQLLVLGVVVVIAIVLFLPQFLAQAGNSVINPFNGNASSVSGLAQFIPANFAGRNNTLQISVSGLSPNSKYEVTLDPGACGASSYVDLGPVTSDASGNVTADLSLSNIDTNANWYVDLHNGDSAGGAVLACGHLNINNTSASIEATNTTLQVSPAPNSENTGQVTPGLTVPKAQPGFPNTNQPGLPNTGVAPGSDNSYDNNVYPRKF